MWICLCRSQNFSQRSIQSFCPNNFTRSIC